MEQIKRVKEIEQLLLVSRANRGAADALTFCLSKLDFWQAREEVSKAGAKTIGAFTLSTPELNGASYRLEQCIHDATIRGRFEKDGAALSVTAWTPRGKNALVVELQAIGRDGITIHPAFAIQDGSLRVATLSCRSFRHPETTS